MGTKNLSWTEDTENQVDFIVQTLHLVGSERILDLACGFGRHSLYLARRGFQVTGVAADPLGEPIPLAVAAGLQAVVVNKPVRVAACLRCLLQVGRFLGAKVREQADAAGALYLGLSKHWSKPCFSFISMSGTTTRRLYSSRLAYIACPYSLNASGAANGSFAMISLVARPVCPLGACSRPRPTTRASCPPWRRFPRRQRLRATVKAHHSAQHMPGGIVHVP